MKETLNRVFSLADRSDLGDRELYRHSGGIENRVERCRRIASFLDNKAARSQLANAIDPSSWIIWKMSIPIFYVSTHNSFELPQDVGALCRNNIRFMYTCLTRIFRLLLPLLEAGSFFSDPVVHRIRHFLRPVHSDQALESTSTLICYTLPHASPQAPPGPLRNAHAMGRVNAGLGQSEGGRRTAAAQTGLCRSTATRQRLSAGAGRGVAADAGVSGTLARAVTSHR